MALNASSIIGELNSLSTKPGFDDDAAARAHALNLSQKLSRALQKPEDAAIELCFYPIFAGAVRVAIDLGLFRLIAESEKAVSAKELAAASGGSENLIAKVRLLRPLSILHFVQEVKENTWSPTPITRAMCIKPVEAAHIHFWDQGTMAAVKMGPFFKKTQHKQPEDPRNGLFQYAFKTGKEAFEYWHEQPDVIDNFNTCMTGIRGSRPSWIEWWPIEERIFDPNVELDDSSPLLVDIAGGRGHDIQAFGRKFSDTNGRLILEDLPAVIDDIKQLDERIVRVKHDFFTPQPIKDARVYFFHFILHDWSDEVCADILGKTVQAMKKGYSKLLLNEFILPNEGCPLFPAGFDLQTMVMHAAQERTESQWRHLLSSVGLQVAKFWIPPGGGEGIIEAELA